MADQPFATRMMLPTGMLTAGIALRSVRLTRAGGAAIARAWAIEHPETATLASLVAESIGTLPLPRKADWRAMLIAGAILGIAGDIAGHAARAGLKRLAA